VRGILTARSPRKKLVTTTVEHSATRELCAHLEKGGTKIIRIEVDHSGALNLDQLRDAVKEDVALVSIMWANNETGVIFPVQQIAQLCKSAGVPFHCDATQAAGKIPVDLKSLGADAASFAAHKFHGPKGTAMLFTRRGLRIQPLVFGGPQEHGRHGGTENVAGIVGTGKAAEQAKQSLPLMQSQVAPLRDRLDQGILQTISETSVNGSTSHRLPNTTNISFTRLEAEAILLLLSEQNICASAGAACSSGSLEPSPILQAMRIDPKIAHGAVRFSLSRYSTEKEIDTALAILPKVISRLRAVLPVGSAT
jgi:cysteine desulfurase